MRTHTHAVKSKMADAEDDEAFLYGDEEDGNKDTNKKQEDSSAAETKPSEEADATKENVNPEEKQLTENGAEGEKEDDDAKEAGELSNEDDEEDDDDDDDDDDDVQVTIGEINTSGTGYGTPYATPVNWNFKGGAAASASKGTPAAGSKHLDLNAEGTVNGVGIYEFDLETTEEKPWRKPGADITDYFNYGFTEDTWKQYCEKQRRMRLELTMQKKIFVHHAGAPTAAGQGDITAGSLTDARTRKAGPPPERRMEGSIDVIGAVGSRVESRRHQDEDMMPPHMIPDGMPKRGFPGNQNRPPGLSHVSGPPMFNVPTSDPTMGPPQHMGGPPISSVSGPPPMGVPPRFPPGGPPGGPGGVPGMMPPGMNQPPPGMNHPPGGFPHDGMPHDAMGFPGRGGLHGRGRGRGFHPGMPGMPPPGDFPPGMDERGPRIPFEDGMPPFYPGDPVQPFPPMMGPPPHGMPWDGGMGRGFMPFRDQFPVGLPRPGGESPGRGVRSDEDSEYGSSEDELRRREREHKKRDKDKDRERSREHRERTRERHADRDRSPRRERDRRDRDRESRRHRDRDKDREKGGEREKREERSSRRERSKEQREKKRHKVSGEAPSTDGQEEGEVVSKRRSRRTRESKQSSVPKQEPAEQEEGQLSSP